jgi:hypothetical protein
MTYAETVARVRELRAEGKSFLQAAILLGIGKCTVAGICERDKKLGLDRRLCEPRGNPPGSPKPPARVRERKQKPPKAAKPSALARSVWPDVPPPPAPVAPKSIAADWSTICTYARRHGLDVLRLETRTAVAVVNAHRMAAGRVPYRHAFARMVFEMATEA